MKRQSINRSVLAASCAAVALLTPATAWAQTEGTKGTDDIIVTAQRRAQRLEDVPMAIAAITPQSAEQRGIRNLQDLGQSISGVQINFQGTFTYPAVRGISSLTTGVGFENNVGVYVDGFYQPDSTAINADFANLESIQVLKGPQGALYGRNATGGAILISTLAPTTTVTGRVEARYGNFNDKSLSGYISGPLSQGLRVSLAGYARKGDGYYDLLDASGVKIGNAAPPHTYSVRAKAVMDLAPNLTATVGYNYTDFQDDRGAMFTNETARPSFLPAKVGRLYEPRTFATNRYSLNQTTVNEGNAKVVLATGLGDLTSYTSYAKRKYKGDFDFDGSWADVSFSFVRQFEDTFQQSLELGVKSVANLDLVIGGTYYNDTTTSRPSDSFAGNRQSGSIFVQYKTRSYAAFIDGTYHLNDQLSLGFGGRYTSETRQSDYRATAFSGGVAGAVTTLDPAKSNKATHNNFSPRVVLTYELADRTNLYGSISRGFRSGFLQPQAVPTQAFAQVFDIRPETITAYEVGFKTVKPTYRFDMAAFYYDYNQIQVGLTVPNPFCSTCGPINLIQNAPKAEVYGVEAQLSLTPVENFHADLNATYLHARYKRFPGVTGTGVSATGSNITGQVQDWTGQEMARAPAFTASGALSYKVPAVAGGALEFSTNLKYTTSYVPNNPSLFGPLSPSNATKQRYRQGQYALVNASVNWTDATETYSVGIWANNLTNVDYRLSSTGNFAGNYGTWAPPRTYGVRAGVKW